LVLGRGECKIKPKKYDECINTSGRIVMDESRDNIHINGGDIL
jgi:hypothetical protein